MTKGMLDNQNRKIVITLLLMMVLIGLSGVVSWKISRMEREACWEELHQSVTQIGNQLEGKIQGDRELLESIATIIAGLDSVESSEVQNIINRFYPQTMISYIEILLPGDRVMLPSKPIQNVEGLLSFEEEAALGEHISGRSVDIRHKDRMVFRNFVPIEKNGKVVAMLYGVVDLSSLSKQFRTTSYGGQLATYLIDGDTGDFLVDTLHKRLGNTAEFKDQKQNTGYSYESKQQVVFDEVEGCYVVASNDEGKYLYYYEPISINNWRVAISISDGVAFSRLNQINELLIRFIMIEGAFLAVYFIWILGKTKNELLEKQKLAENDVLTGLLNRNCYEEKLTKYPAECKESVACVYADVNGLHEVNNTQGHEAGDRMLQTVAKVMMDSFLEGDVYRVGGDEFVAFAKDVTEDHIRGRMELMEAILKERGYYVSMGMGIQEMPVDMESLIKTAEKEMYQEKDRYYVQLGENRR